MAGNLRSQSQNNYYRRIQEAYQHTYKKRINIHIRPKLGKYRMNALSPAILQKYINDLFDAGYSRNTISCIKGLLTGSLTYAVEPLRLLISSPMQGVKLPSYRATPARPAGSTLMW